MIETMRRITKQHKQAIQTAALLLVAIPVLPIYIGLQNGLDWLAWLGLIVVTLGMLIGLWGG